MYFPIAQSPDDIQSQGRLNPTPWCLDAAEKPKRGTSILERLHQRDICEVERTDKVRQISKINLLRGRTYNAVTPDHSGPQVC